MLMSEVITSIKLSYYERNKERILNKQKEYNKLQYAENTEGNKNIIIRNTIDFITIHI